MTTQSQTPQAQPFEPPNILLERGLRAAAITPELRRMMLYDAGELDLIRMARHFAAMLAKTANRPVEIVIVNAFETEDSLWGKLVFYGSEIRWYKGKLEQQADTIQVLAIPNLAALTLPALRACVSLMEANTAYLERHGVQREWDVSGLCWLAACSLTDIGRVSAHLFDRFALHLDARATPEEDAAYHQRVWEWAKSGDMPTIEGTLRVEPPTDAAYDPLVQAAKRSVKPLPPTLTGYLSSLVPSTFSPRRMIAVARLSLALARLDAATEPEEKQVNEAAQIMGLLRSSAAQAGPDGPMPRPPEPGPTDPNDKTPDGDGGMAYPPADALDDPGTIEGGGSLADFVDSVLPQREFASLQLPTRRFRRGTAERGLAVGVRPTDRLEDLAIFQTLLEAAKFQVYRKQQMRIEGQTPPDRLILRPTDLRRYVRVPTAESMLMIVIDFTSLRSTSWQETLEYYLGRAYVERMRIGVVRVGAADAASPYQAEGVMARSLLDNRVFDALNAAAGTTTPLAHGLELAYGHLRSALQHGRQTVARATLILLTDGLGNVPLQNSQADTTPESPVGSQGVKDTLNVARSLAALARLKIIYMAVPRNVAGIPRRLAEALGTTAHVLPHLESVEDLGA